MADLGVMGIFVHPVNGTLMVFFGSELCAEQEHTRVTDKPKGSSQFAEGKKKVYFCSFGAVEDSEQHL